MKKIEAKSVVKTVTSILENKKSFPGIEYVSDLSFQSLELESDKGRIEQVLLGILQNATSESRHGSEIRISMSTRPFELSKVPNKTLKSAPIIDMNLRLTTLLVFSVYFNPKKKQQMIDKDDQGNSVAQKSQTVETKFALDDFDQKPKEIQFLELALMTSKMICRGLYGDLELKKVDQSKQMVYEATFLA